MVRAGKRLMTGIEQAARARGVHEHVTVMGMASNAVFGATGPDKKPSQEYRCVLLQELIKRGVIAPSIVVSYAHKDVDIDQTIDAFDAAMEVYGRALSDGAGKFLVGPPSEMVYRAFNKKPAEAAKQPA
jgi:glutamate-1-semialdehyde 2,1-aminomutase